MIDNLMVRAREGDERAEEELFESLLVRFTILAKRRIWEGDAEDVAQEACMAVLRKYKTVTFTKGFEAWVYGVLKMEIRSYIRVRLDRARKLASVSGIEQTVKHSSVEPDYDFKRRLMDCLKQIIERKRSYARVLNLIHQGYKTNDICQRLRIKPSNFYAIVCRGRRLLENCLQTGTI